MKKYASILLLSLVILSCEKEKDPFLITASHIGELTKEVQVHQLDSVFAQDSIANTKTGDQFISGGTDIEIYDRAGSHLLQLTPVEQLDSASTIANIRIFDDRYKTEKGLTVGSTFKDIQEFYPVSRIENTLSSAVIFIDEINAYVTIDKDVLPSELKFDTSKKIDATQIPDDAKIKQFWIGWE